MRDLQVGLGPNKELLRASLSESFRRHIDESKDWFDYLENYRHALAHKIHLYIPPRRYDNETAEEYRELDGHAASALKERDFNKFHRLQGQMEQLGVFEPWMMHSFGPAATDARPVMFHGQVISDLATVIDIGERMLTELKALGR